VTKIDKKKNSTKKEIKLNLNWNLHTNFSKDSLRNLITPNKIEKAKKYLIVFGHLLTKAFSKKEIIYKSLLVS